VTVADDGSRDRFDAFAAQISHDLRTPLTAWLGFTELLGELPELAGNARAAEYVSRCLSAGSRMLTMIDGLLDYARANGAPRRETVALDDLLPGVLRDLGDLTEGATVIWSGPPVHADPTQLRSLLQHLLSNALLYRRAGPACRVAITTRAITGGAVRVRVADNGSGVPVGRRRDVVTPLIRLRTDVRGAGLGLATCERVVHGHGGTLELTASRGGGLTVAATFLP
jgi:signal transduction histidine kinase